MHRGVALAPAIDDELMLRPVACAMPAWREYEWYTTPVWMDEVRGPRKLSLNARLRCYSSEEREALLWYVSELGSHLDRRRLQAVCLPQRGQRHHPAQALSKCTLSKSLRDLCSVAGFRCRTTTLSR